MNNNTNNKRILKNTIYLYIRTFITIIVTLYTSRVLLSVLGIDDYGIFNVVGGVVATLAFLRGSISNGIQRFLNIELGRLDTKGLQASFASSITVSLIVAVGLVVICELLAPWFLNSKMIIPVDRLHAANVVLQTSILCMAISMFQVPFHAAIIAYEKMSFYAYLSIFESVSKLLIVYLISFFKSTDSLIFYSYLHLLMVFLVFVINFVYVIRNFSLNIRIGTDKSRILDLLHFSGWNIFGTLSGILKSNGLNVVINMFFSPAVNAARGISYQVLSAVNSFVSNFQMASKPQTIQSYASGDIKSTMNLCYYTSRISFYLVWILTVPFLFDIDFILHLWLGDNVPEYTSIFCKIVLLTATIESLGNPLSTVVHATGKLKNYQIVVSLIIIMIIPIAYLLLKLGNGPVSAVLVSLIIAPIAQFSRLIMLKKIVDYSIIEYLKVVIVPCVKICLISLILAYLLSHISVSGVLLHLLYICILALSVAICVYFLGLSKQERTKITGLLKSNLHINHGK